jgi:putative transposase
MDNPDRPFPKSNSRISTEFSEDAQLKIELIESIRSASDRETRNKRIQTAAQQLQKHPRTITRMLEKVDREGLAALTETIRSDRGKHRISPFWQEFIIKAYKGGNKHSLRISRNQVYLKVKAHAEQKLGLSEGEYPSHVTVYKVLEPYVNQQKKKPRHPGSGIRQYIKTTEEDLEIQHSNQIFQADHTKLDILLVDRDDREIGCPYLTPVIDSYSGCIMGFYLGYKEPGSQEVALALRHAILPKQYGQEYELKCEWETYGVPEYFVTDRAKEFKSEHLKQIAFQLGFQRRLRAYPSAGGLIESVFDKINKEVLSLLPGYKGSNVQKRPKEAEKYACLTIEELEVRLVRYFVHHYNQHLYPKIQNQTRLQRWRSGLLEPPEILDERELDICLLKSTQRKVQKYGSVQFENLTYRGDCLLGYECQSIILRYDPRNIITLLAYTQEKRGQPATFLGVVTAKDLEREKLSLEELKLTLRRIRKQGKAIDNSLILSERIDLHNFAAEKIGEKKSRRERRKTEHKRVKDRSEGFNFIDTKPLVVMSQGSPEEVNCTYESTEPAENLAAVAVSDWNQYLEENW